MHIYAYRVQTENKQKMCKHIKDKRISCLTDSTANKWAIIVPFRVYE